ncbi:MAG: hypothetical protein LBT89_00060 [Planctomycetaceae bacterium]|nr:hypothetical protein [Planctomycetaceae bacterium]
MTAKRILSFSSPAFRCLATAARLYVPVIVHVRSCRLKTADTPPVLWHSSVQYLYHFDTMCIIFYVIFVRPNRLSYDFTGIFRKKCLFSKLARSSHYNPNEV